MDGNTEYDAMYQRKIDGLLKSNNKLNGFYSFIGDKSISTIYNYLLNVNAFLQFVGDKSPGELNVDDFSGYMMKIQKNQKGERSSSSYRIEVYSALKKYGTYLVASSQLDRNPMEFIDRPKAIESKKTIEKRENGYLSKNEIKKYIISVEDGVGSERSKSCQKKWKERDMAIIMLFLNTGIRCSAMMKLDVDSIDFNKKILTVTDKESKCNTYDLSDEVLDVIRKWLEKRKELLNGKESDALFISRKRTRMVQKSISDVVHKYSLNIQGKHITPHKLRATYGTQLYDSTKDIYFVQQCMKHDNPRTTELYIRGNKNQTKKASDIMKKLTMD